MNEAAIRLFVYGTLKRGYWNHRQFCREAILIEPATVLGRLYELPSGIPVLEVPQRSILAQGSFDIPTDIVVQRRLGSDPLEYAECSADKWQQIEGELISLPDPARTLPPIDRLEGFRPTGRCLYRRVLLPVRVSEECITTAWCYVVGSVPTGMLASAPLARWG